MASSSLFILCFLTVASTCHSSERSGLKTTTTTVNIASEAEAEHLWYKWTLKNIMLLATRDGCIDSPLFRTKNESIKFKLRFCFLRKGSLQIVPYVEVPEHSTFEIDSELKIFNGSNWNVIANRTTQKMRVDRHSPTFQYSQLLRGLNEELNFDSTIIIICSIDMPLRVVSRVIAETSIEGSKVEGNPCNAEKSQLSQDFGRLLHNKNFTDVVIAAGSHRFPAHKGVLAIRSPVLAGLIENASSPDGISLPMLRSQHLEYLEPVVVEAMLEYIYTDKICNLTDLSVTYGLLGVADGFKMPGLKPICENYLREKLNVDNAVGTLVRADQYGLDRLKKYIVGFITDHFKDIIKTSGYKKLEQEAPGLLDKILSPYDDFRH
ncbi:speckle-type POZ protein B [Fopius arisanus]|uniref:Speckle-type POZ protein B n=1 Tax=Fopius arisanus TaxID=64838 RepID=A0A9R1TZT7_9HYME|nr:PREDICTED: speckle-type POZ protein B-like [Fopius arisanus]XP_011302095.1 PREDICTED: speckle-type POZ protein B-like [Fopius arisanus]